MRQKEEPQPTAHSDFTTHYRLPLRETGKRNESHGCNLQTTTVNVRTVPTGASILGQVRVEYVASLGRVPSVNDSE